MRPSTRTPGIRYRLGLALTTMVSIKSSLIFVFCCAFTSSASAGGANNISTVFNYETDYSSDEILRLIFRGVPLTFDRLLSDNDSYGLIVEEVTFWCIDRDTNQLMQTYINDTEIDKKLDLTKQLWIVMHGWIDNINRTWMQDTLRGWLYTQSEGFVLHVRICSRIFCFIHVHA